jgi:predicted molibdopterin-dependent oxidoreductase YjgC
MIRAKINNIDVTVSEGSTILEAAVKVQIKIPTLCKHPDLPATAACGICVVKAKGMNKMLRACCTPLEEGMEITTHDPEIVEIRRTVIELILSRHPNECLTCLRNNNCELQKLAADFGIRRESYPQSLPELPLDASTGSIVLDPRKCVACGRCIQVCQNMQNVWALSMLERGIDTRMSPAGDIQLKDSPCVSCGQCSAHCPTGAIVENDETAAGVERFAGHGTILRRADSACGPCCHRGSLRRKARAKQHRQALRRACVAWGSGQCSIRTSGQTSPLLKKRANSSSASPTVKAPCRSSRAVARHGSTSWKNSIPI